MSDFRNYEPSEFFEKLVKPTYEEYLAGPLLHHHVKNAVAQLDTMAERMWHWWHERNPARIANAMSARRYREYLAKEVCSDFQLVWDLHDSHKHVELTRGERTVRSAAQSGLGYVGGSFDPESFDPEVFDVGVERFMVKLGENTERDVSEILSNVYEMWQKLLS